MNDFYCEVEDNCKNSELKLKDIVPNREEVRISFNDVSFNYEEGTDILKKHQSSYKPTEKVTFVGRTGDREVHII